MKMKAISFREIRFRTHRRNKKIMEQIENLNKMYQRRRDVMEEGLRELGWDIKPSKATFYLWLPVTKGMTSEEFVNIALPDIFQMIEYAQTFFLVQFV